MKKLLLLVLFAFALHYGWNHRDTLFRRPPGHEAVVVNATDRALLRVRLTVDGQTLVREVVEPGERATLPFQVARDSDFQLEWQWRGREGKANWRGGLVTAGSPPSRTTLTAYADGSVTVQAAVIAGSEGR